MPKIKINDIKMYYEIYGQGPPLLMIMGIGGNTDYWPSRFIDKISENFKVIIFDNRGSGRSDKSDIEYSMKIFADDTINLMDALKIDYAHILGLSMGGSIAQELVLNYPERVSKLILCSTNCGFSKSSLPSPEALKIMMQPREETTPEEISRKSMSVRLTEKFIKGNPEVIEEYIHRECRNPTPPKMYKRQVDAIVKFNTYKRLKNINRPTLIMQGKQDLLTSVENAELLANNIKGAKLTIFEDLAHDIFSQDSDIVIKTLIEFLNS
ncbi:MAG: alpha/beta fold hydrolase [Candidatus Thorarchaeota archaeon]